MSKFHYTGPTSLCPETRVSDKVRSVRSVSVQITLDGPGQILSLVGSGRVVSKFHYADPTRPDQTHGPLGSPTIPQTLSGRRLVRSVSTCTDFVLGSGLGRVTDKVRGSV